MPSMFGVNKSDILRNTIITPGWYPAILKAVNQKAAKTDGSTNTILSFVLVGGKFDGVPVDALFSEKAPGFAVPAMEAFLGRKVNEDGETVDFEAGINKKIMIMVVNGMWNNRPNNQIEDYKPMQVSS